MTDEGILSILIQFAEYLQIGDIWMMAFANWHVSRKRAGLLC